MAGRELGARVAGGWRWLRRSILAASAWRGLGAKLAAGWRWLRGSGWDSHDMEELYGKQTSRGYAAGLRDVMTHRELNPARPQRTTQPEA